MRALERLSRWVVLAGAAFLCMALLGTGARASTPTAQDVWALERAAMAPQSMPAATDCVLCPLCYVAPAPSTHGMGGDCQEPEARGWSMHAASISTSSFFGTGGWHVGLPVRIAYCRWRN